MPEKQADEIFCPSCGGTIKKEAELCPKCGVPKSKWRNAEEVFCTSCGEKIKKEAEICPKCGVRQFVQTQSGQLLSQSGNEKRINKHFFVWVGTFLFGYFGVDRFLRGQIGLGILKILVDWFGIWALIDWIIALTKYGVQGEEFIFIDGKWAS
jgi:RNA polymerase subunit RPABC4/transcription elongation factor Spt4